MADTDKITTARPWLVFGACALAAAVPEVSGHVMSQVATIAAQDLQASTSTMQIMLTMSKVIYSSLMLVAGAVADIYGRRRFLLLGVSGLLVAAILSGSAASPSQLVSGRVIDGLSTAFVVALALAGISTAFDLERRAFAISIYLSFMGLAGLLGPYVAGLLLDGLGWRAAFYAVAVLALVAIVGLMSLLPESLNPTAEKLDVVGAVACALGLVGLVVGIIEANSLGWIHPFVVAAVVIGLCVMAFFVWWELNTFPALLRLELFKNPVFTMAVLVGAIMPFIGSGLYLPLLYYFRAIRGENAATAALAVMPIGLAVTFVSPLAGRLAKYLSARIQMSLGLAVSGAGSFALGWIDAGTSYFYLGFAMTLIGAGVALASARKTAVVMAAAPQEESGAAAALNTASGKLGGVLGNAVLLSLFLALAHGTFFVEMAPSGLPENEVREAYRIWRQAVRSHATDELDQLNPETVDLLRQAFPRAYTVNLGWLQWLGASLSFLAATLTFFVLRQRPSDKPTAVEGKA